MAKVRWVVDENKFLSTKEVKRLEKAMRTKDRKKHASEKTAVRDSLIVSLVLSTGLRVGEVASLLCGDLFLANGRSSLLVRKGKGGKPRAVAFGKILKGDLSRYLGWKKDVGEPVGNESPLFFSPRTGRALTTRAIQKSFKRSASLASLSPHYSIHCLRHTYACFLYKASNWNLRVVQKQLGHSNIATTQVYADVMEPDLRQALEKMYKDARKRA